MKFAVLGTDSDVLTLMQAARAQGHEIVWIGDVRPADRAQVDQIAPPRAGTALDWDQVLWELLLDRATADGVLVGRGNASHDLRAEQLKRLVTESVPVLIAHPIADSVLTYYELDMIRHETNGLVRHYNPLVGHPVLGEAAAWVRGGHPHVGTISQVSCERRLGDSARETVLNQLTRDVELLAAIAGSIRRVSAIGPRGDDSSLAALQIQMTTDGPATVRWSLGPRARLGTAIETTLIGERGTVMLRGRETTANEPIEWSLAVVADGHETLQALPASEASFAAIEQFADAVAAATTATGSVDSTWPAATRAMEVVDAVTLSLHKGRTMDVFQQHLTERMAFRGTMAAIGCGLLLFGFCVVVLMAVLGGIEGVAGQRLLPSWPVALLTVLAFFLLLQIIPMLATKPKRRGPE